MNETETPPPPPGTPLTPAAVLPPASAPDRAPEGRGCLKWGLVGCLGLSVILIAGLLLFARKAPQLIERLLSAASEQVISSAAPDVTPQEKADYSQAFWNFSEAAKAGRVKPERIRDLQLKTAEALRDGTVSREELRGLVEVLKAGTP